MTSTPHADLSTQARREKLTQLAAELYGGDRWKTAFADDACITARSVQRWFEDETAPPMWAILLLEAWIEIRDLERIRSLNRELASLLAN